MLQELQRLIHQRTQKKFFIGHIQGHNNLPGPLTHDNAMADFYTQKDTFTIQKAQESHAVHHQNTLAFKKMFKITKKQTRHIVKQCQQCPPVHHLLKIKVNPRGLKPNEL